MRLNEVKKRLRRQATLIEPYAPPAEPNPLISVFGEVTAACAGEGWPRCCGSPMIPVLQLNLSEAPFVPEGLADVAFLALFVDGVNAPKDGAPNGDCWLLRTYGSVEGLSGLAVPADFERRRPRGIRYRLLDHDFPDYDDVAEMSLPDEITDTWEDEFGAAEGSKLGGWPALLQSEIFWAPNNDHPARPQYVFQLARLERITPFSADTVCYFGRGSDTARTVWALSTQTL